MKPSFLPRRVLWAMILMVGLTTLPYVFALLATPAGAHFNGALLDGIDYKSHLARMQAGLHGSWLYQLLFTAEPHQGLLLQPLYLSLGHVARWTGLSLDLVYQAARVVYTALMVWALWIFFSHFLPLNQAWWALLLCLFGGGLSFILLFIPGATSQISPIEFWLLDAYVFLASFVFPHFAACIALLAISFVALDTWASESRGLLVLFLASVGVAFVQPFHLILIGVTLVIVSLYRLKQRQARLRRLLPGLVLIAIAHATIAGYDLYALYSLPIWQSYTAQNITLSPPPIYYLLGFAPALLPAVAGIVLAIQRRDGRLLAPASWLITVLVMVYAPTNFQRRFTLGVYAPMSIFAIYWLANAAVPWLRARMRRYSLVLFSYGLVATLSTLILFVWLCGVSHDSANRDLYISDSVWSALNWIKDTTPGDSVVLSSFESGGNIAARTGRRVVIGHGMETANYDDKLVMIRTFFSADTPDSWRLNVLHSQNASFVWYSSNEQALGNWQPSQASYLKPAFTSGSVTIYQVELVT